MNKILTITIPSYNMEKYIDKCLTSFIDDRIMKDIEILVVNDGSKDNTLQIAKNYQEKYPNVFIVIDKENGGHGSTINKGIELATGKYFKVIDSDDWVDTNEFVKLVEFLKTTDVDFIMTNYIERYDDSGESIIKSCANQFTLDKEMPFDEICEKTSGMLPMHSATYKTSILKDNNIKLYEKCFYVDVQYNMFPIKFINNCICKDLNVYQYRLGRNGQSVSKEGFLKHIEDHRRVVLSTLKYCKEFDDKNSAKYNYALTIMKSLVTFNYQYTLEYGYDRKDIINSAKKFNKEIIQNYPEYYNFNFGRFRNLLWKHNLKGLKVYIFIAKFLKRI